LFKQEKKNKILFPWLKNGKGGTMDKTERVPRGLAFTRESNDGVGKKGKAQVRDRKKRGARSDGKKKRGLKKNTGRGKRMCNGVGVGDSTGKKKKGP